MSDRRLTAARTIAAEVAEHLQADLSLELWDGSIVPLGPDARDDIRILVRSPGAIRRLLLAPRLTTLFGLYGKGEIDIVGGSPLEAIARWDHLRAVALAKRVSKRRIAGALLPFLLGGAERRKEAAYEGAVAGSVDRGRDDKSLIQFHYDLSNAFYALFLDPEMVYSCGYYAEPGFDLAAAQVAKLDMTCRRLRLKPGERLLEIGCGWGALLCHAARHYGVTAHGVTLSQEQHEFARAKIAALGLEDRVTVELKDYRALDEAGGYDAIAQMEMFEHVGIDNHDRHFAAMHRLLRPRGRYLHQATTRRPTFDPKDFRKVTGYQKAITRYIFPGGEFDHIGMTVTNLERHGFEVHDVENWREHYVLTLRAWAERLHANRAAAEAEVGAERTRLWLLYFSLFAMAFERNTCFVFQTLASKRQTGASGLPMTRADLCA